MATRGRTTFQKRQRELAKKEKQQMKAERRAQRKLERTDAGGAVSEKAQVPPEWGPESESPAI